MLLSHNNQLPRWEYSMETLCHNQLTFESGWPVGFFIAFVKDDGAVQSVAAPDRHPQQEGEAQFRHPDQFVFVGLIDPADHSRQAERGENPDPHGQELDPAHVWGVLNRSNPLAPGLFKTTLILLFVRGCKTYYYFFSPMIF